MVTTVQPDNTLAFPTGNSRPGRSRNTPRIVGIDEQAIQRLQLSHLLQSTLDLEQVLMLFFREVGTLLGLTSLSYGNDNLTAAIEFGSNSKHSCHYQLVNDAENLGKLTVTRNKRFTSDDLLLLENLISCLICPLRNALLYREAVQSALQDPLTGVGNRVALETTLKREISIAARHRQPLSVLVVDLDHFKAINDTHGHSAGDCVLKDAARLLAFCCRDADACYRFGGEEFVIILNQTDLDGAMITAERIRQSLAEMTTHCHDASIAVTASIGVAALREGDNLQSLFNRADRAMYAAKSGGRNRVVVDSQHNATEQLDH